MLAAVLDRCSARRCCPVQIVPQSALRARRSVATCASTPPASAARLTAPWAWPALSQRRAWQTVARVVSVLQCGQAPNSAFGGKLVRKPLAKQMCQHLKLPPFCADRKQAAPPRATCVVAAPASTPPPSAARPTMQWARPALSPRRAWRMAARAVRVLAVCT